MRRTRAQIAQERAVNEAYSRLGSGVQVNMMDLGKILDAGRAAAAAGTSVDEAISAALATYRTN